MKNWKISEIWNSSIEKPEREIVARDHLWASELGGSMIDRWHKLKGTPYTNPPNSRSMRKFMAGDIWEWIIKTVLVQAGIPFKTQERVELKYEGLLPITGKIDFIAGGKFDYFKAIENLNGSDIPDFIKNPAKAIIDAFKAKYGDYLPEKILEIKSVGSYIFEGLLEQDNPKTHHMLQGAVYKLTKNLPTDVVYVCRDDCRLLQYSIDEITPTLEKEIKKDLEELTRYYKDNVEPPKEDLIIFENGKFKTNWKVTYSPYLTMLYTYKVDGKDKKIETPDEYFEFFTPKVSAWNRVLTRVKNGDKMTPSNLEYIEEIKSYGFENIINNLQKKNEK